MLKIERINKESEKQNKILSQEVKDTEIYEIIHDAQQELYQMQEQIAEQQ